jgi:hypothetical protein
MSAVLVLFEVGFVRRTPDAMLQLVTARETESCLIHRHEHGDFGQAEVCQCMSNLCAIAAHQGVIRSFYRLATGAVVSVETDLAAQETRLQVAHAKLTENLAVALPATWQARGGHHA